VFLYRAFYESGNASPQSDVTNDFKWVTRGDLSGTLDERVLKGVEETLLDEE
jgi:hypothetical protein